MTYNLIPPRFDGQRACQQRRRSSSSKYGEVFTKRSTAYLGILGSFVSCSCHILQQMVWVFSLSSWVFIKRVRFRTTSIPPWVYSGWLTKYLMSTSGQRACPIACLVSPEAPWTTLAMETICLLPWYPATVFFSRSSKFLFANMFSAWHMYSQSVRD